VLGAVAACSSNANEGGFFPDAGSGGDGSGGSGGDNGGGNDGSVNPNPPPGIQVDGGAPDVWSDGGVTVTDTIYANTDDSLYSMDPKTKVVTLVGAFSKATDAGADPVTDVAVNAAGDVYANTETAIYKATLPATGGVVPLTPVATIAVGSGQRFYALAFAPGGALGASETLIGGDGNGEIFAIDTTNGSTKDLGNFGNDPSIAGNFLALSGDLVFYADSTNKPTGLATIRSCTPPATAGKAPKCIKTNDYLAGVDMTAMATAYTSGTPAKSLNAGIYGGSATASGNGIGFGEVFGLGAWEGNIYGFSRAYSGDAGAVPPQLILIDGTTNGGGGTLVPQTFGFSTNGWSGAGVTTKVTILVGPPPPPPPPPK
jgi:hypothetical protein